MKSINIKNIDKKTIARIVCICAGVAVIAIVIVMLLRPEGTANTKNVSNSDITDSHMYQVYSDNFTVDADITSPLNENAEILYTEYIELDEKKLVSLFMNSKNPTREVASYDSNIVFYRTGDAYFITASKYGYTRGETQSIRHLAFPTENFNTRYGSWRFNNELPCYDTVYKNKNLSFMTSEDAVDSAYSVLQQLNISAFKEDAEIYAIDCETMQTYQDKMKKEYPDSAVNYELKDKFTEDDEFYIVCFTAAQNQIPVTHAYYLLWGSDREVMGSNIKIYVSKKGVFYFDFEGIYSVQGVSETPNKLLTVQEAANKAFEVYNSVITTDKATVDEIRFEYAPVPYNQNFNEVKLTPAWSFHLTNETVDVGTTEEIILINAVTGERIN